MKVVIFGLSVSSAWGNGHATLWRGLCKSLAKRGHQVVFFERDVPYYANTRDLTELPGGQLILYSEWHDISQQARVQISEAEVAVVTSYCPDALIAAALIADYAQGVKAFYDLDSPVTLARIQNGEAVDYVGPRGYCDFDVVLSYAGGKTLEALSRDLGARKVAPLYGSVDPDVHYPVRAQQNFSADLSYLGTYSADRNEALNNLFITPARMAARKNFLIGGSMYSESFPSLANLRMVNHVAPAQHPAFYCSSVATLNVTRRPMAELGFCPSGRLFEAAACGVPVLSDWWEGLDSFYVPGAEILTGSAPADTLAVLDLSREELRRIGLAARERTLDCHTSDKRAQEFEAALFSHAPMETACGA